MFKNYARSISNALFKPTVRLSFDFPFNPFRSLKLYGKSLLYFTVGSLFPIAFFLLLLKIVPLSGPPSALRDFLLSDKTEGLLLTALSLATFGCGFGLQLFCIRQAVHKEGRRLRDILSLNLKSLNGSWLKALGFGFITFLIGMTAEQLMGRIYTLPSSDPTADFIQTLTGSALFLMAALAMIGPFVEEVVFRGFLFNVIGKYTSQRLNNPTVANLIAVFSSALVFGLMHMNLPALPFYVVLGAVYAEAYRRSGSLIVPIVAHVLNNSLIVVTLILRMN